MMGLLDVSMMGVICTLLVRSSFAFVEISSGSIASQMSQYYRSTSKLITDANSQPVIKFYKNVPHSAQKAYPSALYSAVEEAQSTVHSDGSGLEIVEVDLDDRSYPIYIGTDLYDDGELIRKHVKGKKVLVVTNDVVGPLYLDKIVKALEKDSQIEVETVVLPDGEENKTMEVLMMIMEKALATRMDRKCTFVALGGGVIGDMVGFAAAIYQRGVNFIQVPTTLMAMVDSSVGGKTAVNHPLGKNMIGAFYQPQAVVIDTASLNSLPDRELASGVSEVIKYGLIRDAPFFEWQEANMEQLLARDPAALAYAVKRSCENKAEVVAEDEKEAGVRATLNLGHTFGHAIESGLGYGAWLHGEAVSAGTVMAADMSERLGWITPELRDRAVALLARARLPVDVPRDGAMTPDVFRKYMAVDKKVENGQLRLILLKGALGNCVFTGDFDAAKLDEVLEKYTQRD
ncbi:unnamed protein product [Heterosigma akashiwo]|uniref:3-dehydroquinate synthase, chloroplastic n=1 Tax=Heterosigma akashiwo TaxID=2829 RepID=A0A6T5P5V7_HETAK|mmetsp:Transcript_22133/g.30455  ORF Transcript_22133/g.30455 Transcript_22133/m.30455 type:complete len:459 (+) Transcript_22133:75-1451(+)